MTRSPMALLQEVPALKPIALLVGLAMAVALGISLYMWSRGPDWTPLTTQLDASEAAAVVRALEGQGIPARLGASAGSVSVPRTQLDAARLHLAASDVVGGGSGGFAMLAESPGFGVSQFMESARYQYALETELARTIASLSPVRAARVHLAVAKDSAFVRDNRRASASVVVDLRPGRGLDRAQAQAIVNLVASSVPQMDADAVTVVDSAGNLLSARSGDDSATGAARQQYEMARQTEALLSSRIIGLLEAMVGSGRVRAQVTVEHDEAVVEQASERVQADPDAIRSERVREERGPGVQRAQGPAGAAANMPNDPNAGAVPDDDMQMRDVERDYALGREYAYTRQPAGRLRRVSAAVLIDHVNAVDGEGQTITRALNDAELARVRALVEGAIGFDGARGDQLSIDNVAFATGEAPVMPAEAPMWEQMLDGGWVQMAARNAGGVILLLVLIFTVLRPTLRALLQPVTVQAIDAHDHHPQLGRMAEAEMDDTPQGVREAPYEKQLQVARSVVQQDPKRVAQLMRTWVGNDG